MPKLVTLPVRSAQYALEINGQQDEYGLNENAYRFQAAVVSLAGQADLSVVHGLMVQRESRGDLCVKILQASDDTIRCKQVQLFHGLAASKLIEQGVDVLTQVTDEKILFLHHPTVVDVDEDHEPGYRLFAALKRHFDDASMEVVADLGTTEESKEFNDYFFPDMDMLDLKFSGVRFLQGRWGEALKEGVESYSFGVIYE